MKRRAGKFGFIFSVIFVFALAVGTLTAFASEAADGFYGCWEYYYYYDWICINEDGTWEWYFDDGTSVSGSWYMDGETLYLEDEDMSFTLDGSDLTDSDGDALYASELPDFGTDSDDSEDDSDTADASAFIGCWKYETEDIWINIIEDGTCEWYNDDSSYSGTGTWYMDDDLLFLDDGDGNIIYYEVDLCDSTGEILFESELPDGYPIFSEKSYDGEVSDEAAPFIGCWEYDSTFDWICIYDDETYFMYDSEGSFSSATWKMDDGTLCLNGSDLSLSLVLLSDDDQILSPSEMPDADSDDSQIQESSMADSASADFLGCWKYDFYDYWLLFNEDGTYEWYFSDGESTSSTWYVEDETLYLDDKGYTYTLYEDGLIDSDNDTLSATELPDFTSDSDAADGESADTSAFAGCWKYDEDNVWLTVNEDGSWEWYNDDSLKSGSGTCKIEKDEDYNYDFLYLYDEEGNEYSLVFALTDSEWEILFPSELPDSFKSDSDKSYDGEVSDEAASFLGCWEYDSSYDWICIYDDGTYCSYDSDGDFTFGTWEMDGETLCIGGSDMSYSFILYDGYGNTLSASEMPDLDSESDEDLTAEDIIGCWEYDDYGIWVEFFEDGTSERYGNSGTLTTCTWYLEGNTLYEEYESYSVSYTMKRGRLVDSNGSVLSPSEMPDDVDSLR